MLFLTISDQHYMLWESNWVENLPCFPLDLAMKILAGFLTMAIDDKSCDSIVTLLLVKKFNPKNLEPPTLLNPIISDEMQNSLKNKIDEALKKNNFLLSKKSDEIKERAYVSSDHKSVHVDGSASDLRCAISVTVYYQKELQPLNLEKPNYNDIHNNGALVVAYDPQGNPEEIVGAYDLIAKILIALGLISCESKDSSCRYYSTLSGKLVKWTMSMGDLNAAKKIRHDIVTSLLRAMQNMPFKISDKSSSSELITQQSSFASPAVEKTDLVSKIRLMLPFSKEAYDATVESPFSQNTSRYLIFPAISPLDPYKAKIIEGVLLEVLCQITEEYTRQLHELRLDSERQSIPSQKSGCKSFPDLKRLFSHENRSRIKVGKLKLAEEDNPPLRAPAQPETSFTVKEVNDYFQKECVTQIINQNGDIKIIFNTDKDAQEKATVLSKELGSPIITTMSRENYVKLTAFLAKEFNKKLKNNG